MSNVPTEVATETVADHRTDPEHALLDVRPTAAYNGWRLRDEPRGGHVSGARNVPLAWTRRDDWQSELSRKGVEPGTPVTVYGYGNGDAAEMAERLRACGYDDVSVYAQFLAEWVADPDRPLDRLARYRHLVHPAWLDDTLRNGTRSSDGAAEATGESNGAAKTVGTDETDLVVCHVHYDDPADYERGHVPGAIALDTLALESPDDWNRRPPGELRDALEAHGISHDATVVVYGRSSTGGCGDAKPGQTVGQLAAMRCAAIMLYAGVDDVRVLNGGLSAWEAAGFDLETEPTRPRPVSAFGVEVPANSEYVVDMPGVKALLADDDGELVSVRSWAEFVGEESGYDYIDATGRVPGATFGNCGRDAYDMANYRNPDGTVRDYHEVVAEWADRGIVPEKRVAFYCGTGWRSSEAFLNAYLLGWDDVAVYDGGWYEWSADPDAPVARGVPEGVEAPSPRDG
ncbi:MAG: sulfurtransferase [Haloarculaceae archaeon]